MYMEQNGDGCVVAIGGFLLVAFFGYMIYAGQEHINKTNQEIERSRQAERQHLASIEESKTKLSSIQTLNNVLFREYQEYKIRNFENKIIEDVTVDYFLDISTPMTFKNCTFTNFMIQDQDLNKITFDGCTFNNSKFFNLNIAGVSMFNCSFTNSEFAVCYFGENFKYYNWSVHGLGFNQNKFHESFTKPASPNALEQEINIDGDNTKVDITNVNKSTHTNSFETFVESSKE